MEHASSFLIRFAKKLGSCIRILRAYLSALLAISGYLTMKIRPRASTIKTIIPHKEIAITSRAFFRKVCAYYKV